MNAIIGFTSLASVRFDSKEQGSAQFILEDVGFIVDTSAGSIAAEQIKNMLAGTYDLILMDVRMPIMNGFAAKPIETERTYENSVQYLKIN